MKTRYLTVAISLLLAGSTCFGQGTNVVRAILSLQSNDLSNAVKEIDQAVHNPETNTDPKAWSYRGEIYVRIASQPDNFPETAPRAADEAFTSYLNSLKYDSDGRWTQQNLKGLDRLRQIYLGVGDKALKAQDYQQCYKVFDRTQKIFQTIAGYTAGLKGQVDTTSMFYFAYAADRIGKTADAKKVYRQLVELKYNDKFLYDLLAKLYLREKDYSNALAIVRKGEELLPDESDLLITELQIYQQSGATEDAIPRYQKAIDLNPDWVELRVSLGMAYQQLSEKAAAAGDPVKTKKYEDGMVSAYRGALRIDPENFKATFNLGTVFFNDAVEVSKQMSELSSNESAKLGAMEAKRNDLLKQAVPYLEKARQILPNDAATLNALRQIYLQLNDAENYKKINEALNSIEGGN